MSSYSIQSTGLLRGLNQNEDPHSMRPGDLIVADNVARWGSTVGTRPGLTRPGSGEDFENAIDEGNHIQGMYEWRSDFDGNREMLVIAEHTDNAGGGAGASDGCSVFYEDNARFTAGGQLTAGQNYIFTMTEHNNIIWGAGGQATDNFWYLDPSNHANAPTAVALPCSAGSAYPQYVISWRNWLLCNGFRGNTVADCNPSTTRYCDFAQDPTTASNWNKGNTIGFAAYGDNFCTGFGTYRDNNGDYLIILGNKILQAVVLNSNPLSSAGYDFSITDAIENGCVGQRAYVSLGLDSGDAVYVSERGIHSLRQSQQYGSRADTFLSWKIRPFWETVNRSRLRYTCGVYDHVNGWILIAISTGSNTAHDTILALDVKDQKTLTSDDALWYIWKFRGGVQVNDMRMIRDSSDNWKLALATTKNGAGGAGSILYLSTSTFTDVQVDGSTSIVYSATLRTSDHAYGSPLMEKRIGDVMLTIQPGGSYTPIYRTYFDYGSRKSGDRQINMTAPPQSAWGSAEWGVSEWGESFTSRDVKLYATGSGKTISHEVTHAGSDQEWRISKIDFAMATCGESIGDSSNA